MSHYEYRVVPSPRRAKRAKGAKTPQDRYARTLAEVINAEAAEGWEYLRADTLPVDEKKGMLSAATEVYQTVLIFRRATAAQVSKVAEPRDEPTFSRRARMAPEPETEVEAEVEERAEKPAFSFGPARKDD